MILFNLITIRLHLSSLERKKMEEKNQKLDERAVITYPIKVNKKNYYETIRNIC